MRNVYIFEPEMARYIGYTIVHPNAASYNAATGRDEEWRTSDDFEIGIPQLLAFATDPPSNDISFQIAQNIPNANDPRFNQRLRTRVIVNFQQGGFVDIHNNAKYYYGNIQGIDHPFRIHLFYMNPGEIEIPEPPSLILGGNSCEFLLI